jgi:sec-independent protein translocase protein TatA
MTPLVLGLGVPELLIILAVVLLLFGGARLAGLGKTKGLKSVDSQQQPPLNPGPGPGAPTSTDYQAPPQANTSAQPPSGAAYQQPPRANQDPSATDLRNDA